MYRFTLDKIYKVNTNTIQTIYKINTNTKQNRHCKYEDIVGEGQSAFHRKYSSRSLMASWFICNGRQKSIDCWNNLLAFYRRLKYHFVHYSVVFCSYNHIIRSKNANKLAIFGRIMLKLRLKTEKIYQNRGVRWWFARNMQGL